MYNQATLYEITAIRHELVNCQNKLGSFVDVSPPVYSSKFLPKFSLFCLIINAPDQNVR